MLEDDDFTYDYDANGALLSKKTKTDMLVAEYVYDARGKMTEAKVYGDNGILERKVTYGYDGLGRMTWRKTEVFAGGVVTQTSEKRYVYDGINVIMDLGPNGEVYARYIYGPGIDEPLAVVRGGETYYYLRDAQNSVIMITDSQGNIINRYIYDSFGNFTLSCPSESIGKSCIPNRYTYTGREWDQDISLYFYRDRWYDSTLGRFTSIDRMKNKNKYIYARNNPIMNCDPLGYDTQQYGFTVSGGAFGFGGTIAIGFAKDDDGNKAFYIKVGGGAQASAIGGTAGVEGTFTNAQKVKDLEGYAAEIGGTLAVGGGVTVEGVGAEKYQGGSITIGVGAEATAGEFHAYNTYTEVLEFEEIRSVWNDIKNMVNNEIDKIESTPFSEAVESIVGVPMSIGDCF